MGPPVGVPNGFAVENGGGCCGVCIAGEASGSGSRRGMGPFRLTGCCLVVCCVKRGARLRIFCSNYRYRRLRIFGLSTIGSDDWQAPTWLAAQPIVTLWQTDRQLTAGRGSVWIWPPTGCCGARARALVA